MSDNSTVCRKQEAPNPPPLIQNGDFHFQTHHIGFILCGTFAIISTVVSVWLISKHLRWYTNKREQRYVVRILFMVPLYALISFGSFYFWNQSTPIVLVRDSYEAVVLTAFFYLLLMYLSDDPEEQKRIFLKKGLSREADRIATQTGHPVKKWCFPLGFLKWKPSDGLYFLQLMKWGVLQYCVIRPTTTLAAVILDSMGLYCDSSWNPRWGHAYIVVIISVSVSIAMYCLVQLYLVVAAELAPYKPLLKLFSIKAVVFLTFWQATFLSMLTIFGVIKNTEYMTAEDITIGIGAVIEAFEMMIFAFLHVRAFTYRPYKEIAVKAAKGHRPTPTPRWRSLGHTMDFRETFREIWIGCVYMFDKLRGKEPKPDFGARRIAHYEIAFGRSRVLQGHSLPLRSTKGGHEGAKHRKSTAGIEIERDVSVELEGHKQFLGLSRYDRYSLHPDREKSDGLEDQINRELQQLGYPKLTVNLGPLPEHKPPIPVRLPWWRTLYDRISQSGQEADLVERETFLPRRQFSHRGQNHHQRADGMGAQIMDNHNVGDLPPAGVLGISGLARVTQHPGPGWGQDRRSPGFWGDDPRLTASGDGVNGIRTANTEHPGSDPFHHQHQHQRALLNFGNRHPLPSHLRLPSLLGSRNLRNQPQAHVPSQPLPAAPAAGASRSAYLSLPHAPRGVLVFPPPPGHGDLELEHEFDPWKEHMDNPSYREESEPPLPPPKDVPTRYGNQTLPNGSSERTETPHRRSRHRREPALPSSPGQAPLPPEQDTNRTFRHL